MSAPKDPVKYEEWRRNLSEVHRGKKMPPFSEDHRTNLSNSLRGKKRKPLSDDHKRKIGDAVRGENHPFYGKHHTKETRDRISATLLEHHPGRGIPLSDLHRRRISESNTGKKSSREYRIILSCSHRGISISEFDGFQHQKPYCELWTPEFRERVRVFFGRRCVECQMTEEENGRKLDVHHVNYDKQTCCKEGESIRDKKFVALCRLHNLQANTDREFWEDWYVEIINEFYGGQCYLPK